MIENFLNILVSPDTKSELEYNSQNNLLIDRNAGIQYNFINSVPILLPQNLRNSPKTELHEKFSTDFDYISHYSEDAKLFDYFEQYECEASNFENGKLREIIIGCVHKQANMILDVGCGSGWVANHFLNQGRTVVSMDVSAVNPVRIAEKYPLKNHLAVVADVYAAPFKEQSFDCIIASEVIEHVANPKAFIEALLPLLKPNGKLIVSTPHNEKLQYHLCVHCNKPTPKNAHLHSFTDSNISELLPHKGYSISISKAIDFYLVKLRTHIILKYLPFSVWKLIDSIFCNVLKKPTKFIIEIAKR